MNKLHELIDICEKHKLEVVIDFGKSTVLVSNADTTWEMEIERCNLIIIELDNYYEH